MKKKSTTKIMIIVSMILAILSISQWENCFWERGIVPFLVAILSAVALAAMMVFLWMAKKSVIVLVIMLIYGIILTLDLQVHRFSSMSFSVTIEDIDTMENIKTNIGDSLEILDTAIIDNNNITIVGKKNNSPLCKYLPWKFSTDSADNSILSKLIPEWFFNYMDVKEPWFYKLNDSLCNLRYNQISNISSHVVSDQLYSSDEYLSDRIKKYLYYKYSGYDFLINIVSDETDSTDKRRKNRYSLRNNYNHTYKASPELIVTPYPLLREIIYKRDELLQRFYSYRNLILYTFDSPFTKYPIKDKALFNKKTLTRTDLDLLGLNKKQKEEMAMYLH